MWTHITGTEIFAWRKAMAKERAALLAAAPYVTMIKTQEDDESNA